MIFPAFSITWHTVLKISDLKHILEFSAKPDDPVKSIYTGSCGIYVLIKFTPAGAFNRTLYLQIFGFFIFFLLISIRDHMEPNWTIPCTIPIIIILAERINKDQVLYKYSRRIILPSLGLVLACRFTLMDSNGISRLFGYNGKKAKYEFIETVARDLPVVFLGSYQPPSLYHFFTGREGMVISSIYSRQTQFDIWQFEKKYHNKRVFVSSVEDKRSRIYRKGSVNFHGFFTDSLQTVNRMKINYDLEKEIFHAI